MITRLILGHSQHGKGTVASILAAKDKEVHSCSSSFFVAQLFMFDLMKQEYGYETFQQCFRDRHNHRKFWHDEISKFNTHDKTRLARAMLEKYNTYDGMRCPFELTGSFQQDLFNYIYWVDAGDRKPKEPEDSMKISFDMVLNHPDRRAFLIFVDNSQEGKGNIVFKGVRKKSYYPYTPIISTIYL